MSANKISPASSPRMTLRLPPAPPSPARRISSGELLQEHREIEIEHGGKIYRLRVTQLNKLILTA